jgi:glycerophosphoryl diester phosphodiesterase
MRSVRVGAMRRPLLLVLALLATLVVPAAAGAKKKAIQIQAHRGGSVTFGKPTFPENTLPGFERAAKNGFVVEWDTHVTKDGVPIVIHDGTYDRTTKCAGPDNALSFAYVESKCKSDVLGAPMSSFSFRHVKPTVPIPRLSTALAAMKKLGATVSLEINDYPTYPDYDPTFGFARKVVATIRRSKFPLKHLIIQSFFAPNLAVARKAFPSVRISQLFLGTPTDPAFAIKTAKASHATYVSPEWPIDAAFVRKMHAAGFKVVPYTLDTKAQVLAAAKLGIDALITDDPFRARRALG